MVLPAADLAGVLILSHFLLVQTLTISVKTLDFLRNMGYYYKGRNLIKFINYKMEG